MNNPTIYFQEKKQFHSLLTLPAIGGLIYLLKGEDLLLNQPLLIFVVPFIVFLSFLFVMFVFKRAERYSLNLQGIQTNDNFFYWDEVFFCEHKCGKINQGKYTYNGERFGFKAIKNEQEYSYQMLNYGKFDDVFKNQKNIAIKEKIIEANKNEGVKKISKKINVSEKLFLSILSSFYLFLIFISFIFSQKYKFLSVDFIPFNMKGIILISYCIFLILNLFTTFKILFPIQKRVGYGKIQRLVFGVTGSMVLAGVLSLGTKEMIYGINNSKYQKKIDIAFEIKQTNPTMVEVYRSRKIEMIELHLKADGKIRKNDFSVYLPLRCSDEIKGKKRFAPPYYQGWLKITYWNYSDEKECYLR